MTLKRSVAKGVVWLTFVWLALLAGFIVWSGWSYLNTERETPTLIAAVDKSVRSVSIQDSELLERLILTSRIQSLGEPGATDVLSLVPVVQGAEPFQFTVTEEGAAAIGYRGTRLAEGVCVRSELFPTGTVETSRASCTVW